MEDALNGQRWQIKFVIFVGMSSKFYQLKEMKETLKVRSNKYSKNQMRRAKLIKNYLKDKESKELIN
jgi:hypothetical protein